MRKVLLSLVAVMSLFAVENNTKNISSQPSNKSDKKIIQKKKMDDEKHLTRQQMFVLAKKHINYVIDYKDFLRKLNQKQLDYKKPVILLIGTPDCKWTKEEMIDLLGYPPLWKEVKNNFTLVNVNLLKDKLPEEFLISITPTMYFVSPINGSILTNKPVAGYVDKDDLLVYLKGLKKAWDIYLKKQKINKRGGINE